ncbi:3-deoxy-7-phosphoheptulonate synthase [Desulfitobacterium sp.]|uniref:3-deoxy-7-phosphoheptulonate synthase n=1 Tax=Desulfitobacterium sp. TaxID=49981 RepID=UPI002B21C54A|nr:3-deoxy-7-phosphoheptulonate synthase [Desulfitobacterium sp.]MEA4900824.1 3-deoxy-7-phosphoheptulonate synthase [Desulfitobacterium sp.]
MNLPLVSLKDERTKVQVKNTIFGGNEVILMGGPCAVESEAQMAEAAKGVKAAGGQVLRGGVFKPRTSPYSFQGLGEEGLDYLVKAAAEYDLLTITEVVDKTSLELLADQVDILQIGSRNMQNFELLKWVGKLRKPVVLKRGLSATIEEWLSSAEYILAGGNSQVILCERGIRTYEPSTRNTLDLSAVGLMKELTHLPIIVDPSHAAGRRDLIAPLAKGAIAGGADGLLIEMHPHPEAAKSDGDQSLTPNEFEQLSAELVPIAKAIGRRLVRPSSLETLNDLQLLRNRMDEIDRDIAELLAQRMKTAQEIAKCKLKSKDAQKTEKVI